jgi:DNA-binding NarL/FixJ family response regulator
VTPQEITGRDTDGTAQESAGQTRVLVADRLTLYRHGVIGLLREARPNWACDAVGSIDELEARIRYTDILVIDIRLPGLTSLRQLRSQLSSCRVVAVSECDDRATILDCLAAGASAYLLRDATPAQFLHAMDTTRAGGVYAPDALVKAGTQAAPGLPMPPAHLTGRQRDVFQLLAEGCPTKTIARRLDLGVGTVKVHLAAIYRALDARNRLEAVTKAHRQFALN